MLPYLEWKTRLIKPSVAAMVASHTAGTATQLINSIDKNFSNPDAGSMSQAEPSFLSVRPP